MVWETGNRWGGGGPGGRSWEGYWAQQEESGGAEGPMAKVLQQQMTGLFGNDEGVKTCQSAYRSSGDSGELQGGVHDAVLTFSDAWPCQPIKQVAVLSLLSA